MSEKFSWSLEDIQIDPPEEGAMRNIEKRSPGRPKGSALNGRRRVLTDDEVRRLKAAADRDGIKYGLVVRLILELALRSCELVRMKVEDFNFHSSPPQVVVRGAKGGFEATYCLPPKLALRVRRWLRLRAIDSPWLFPSRMTPDLPMTTVAVQGTFKSLCAKAKIQDRSIHDLRHTACTRMARAGDTAIQIAHRLRHRDLRSAQTYIDFADNAAHDRAMVSRYED